MCAASPSSAARVSLTTRAVLRPSTTRTTASCRCRPCRHVDWPVHVWGDLLAGSKVELGRGQGALADPQTYQTAEPDIFVGGDVYTGPSFAIDAIAAGHEAAVSIHRFVQPGSTLTIGRNQRRYTALDRDDVVIESYDNASREVAHVDREREKAAPFSEYVETFTEEQVRAETARCLGCGAS
ncbi:MAG: hypothetical protein ACLTYW_08200, partial [Collinsella sp.]